MYDLYPVTAYVRLSSHISSKAWCGNHTCLSTSNFPDPEVSSLGKGDSWDMGFFGSWWLGVGKEQAGAGQSARAAHQQGQAGSPTLVSIMRLVLQLDVWVKQNWGEVATSACTTAN